MTLDDQIAILQAIKEGKKIEARARNMTGNWCLDDRFELNFRAFDYRIVPEPRCFTVFKYGLNTYAQPCEQHIPDGATIICTAVEELKSEAVGPYLEALKQNLARP